MNGIGAYWMPAKLRSWLTKKFSFAQSAAAEHDANYSSKMMSRRDADNCFITIMMIHSKNDLQIVISFVFWVLVRLFGWISWRKT